MATIGERLRVERVRLGMSQEALAEACGVTRRTQVNYETDKHRPALLYLDKLAKLGIDTEFVMTGARQGDQEGASRASLALLEHLLTTLGYSDFRGILNRAKEIATGAQSERSGKSLVAYAAELVGKSRTMADVRVLSLEQAQQLDLSLLAEAIEMVEVEAANRSIVIAPEKRAILIAQLYANSLANDRMLNGQVLAQLLALMG